MKFDYSKEPKDSTFEDLEIGTVFQLEGGDRAVKMSVEPPANEYRAFNLDYNYVMCSPFPYTVEKHFKKAILKLYGVKK